MWSHVRETPQPLSEMNRASVPQSVQNTTNQTCPAPGAQCGIPSLNRKYERLNTLGAQIFGLGNHVRQASSTYENNPTKTS